MNKTLFSLSIRNYKANIEGIYQPKSFWQTLGQKSFRFLDLNFTPVIMRYISRKA
ncbi:hypothetical protein VCRA2133E348_620024 [Vibrio crassostreae]|nr:hypothetical protein VCRA2133E348_620024 [Vibrio crassostreae]CAK3590781.1 hypothetical protein VCRA213O314_650025 [Vibrio crassostreae]